MLIGLVILVRRFRIWGGTGKEDPCVSENVQRRGWFAKAHFKVIMVLFYRPNVFFKIANDIEGRGNVNCQPVLTIFYVLVSVEIEC